MKASVMRYIDYGIVAIAIAIVVGHHHKTLRGVDNGLNTPFINTVTSTHQGVIRGHQAGPIDYAGATQISGSGQG